MAYNLVNIKNWNCKRSRKLNRSHKNYNASYFLANSLMSLSLFENKIA